MASEDWHQLQVKYLCMVGHEMHSKSRKWKEARKKEKKEKERSGCMLFAPACRNPTATWQLSWGELVRVTRSLSYAVRWFLWFLHKNLTATGRYD